MMVPYLAQLGDSIYVGENLDAANNCLTDLPILIGTCFAFQGQLKSLLVLELSPWALQVWRGV